MFNFKDPKDLLNKQVIINYNGKPYPGLVVDIDEQDVRVRCVHRIGKLDKCHFYWPKCLTDESLYDMKDIIAIIPEPEKICTKYFEDPKIWEMVLKYFQWLILVFVA